MGILNNLVVFSRLYSVLSVGFCVLKGVFMLAVGTGWAFLPFSKRSLVYFHFLLWVSVCFEGCFHVCSGSSLGIK